jgi:hypothetical protein
VREGGNASANALAQRVLGQMAKLGLELTLTAGVARLGDDPANGIAAARTAADGVAPGQVGTAS